MASSYKPWQNPPVAKKTMIAGFTPRPAHGKRPHLVAVVAFDGVVLGDLSTACEVFGLATRKDGRTAYEVRVCSESVNVESMHVALRVPWRLSSLAQADTVIVPGINDVNRPVPASVLRVIRRAAERGARVASIAPARSCWRQPASSTASAPRRTGSPPPIWPVVILPSISTRLCFTWTTAAC